MLSLFDRDYYLSQNQDLACQPDVDPLVHFLSHGGLEGRDPHPLFDCSYYLSKNPEVAEQQINPLVHFLDEGARQGFDPHPLFSTSHYLAQGLTLNECNDNALLHYLTSGAGHKFDPHPLFKSQYYLHQLQESGLKDLPSNPLIHFLTSTNAAIAPSPIFDGVAYALRYPDVAESNVNPLLHYVLLGQHEGRMGLKLANLSADINSYASHSFKNARSELNEITKGSFSHLIIISCLLRGGYERCASNYARAIAQTVGSNNILFLVTDVDEITCREWLPVNVRIANLASLFPSLTSEEKALLFMDLVARRKPSYVIAINASLFWSALDTYIEAWDKEALPTKLVSYLGSYEHYVDLNNHGFNDGALARLIEKIDLFVTDTQRLRDRMVTAKMHIPLSESKVVACYKSLSESLHQSLSLQSNRIPAESSISAEQAVAGASILWASRIQEFKQPEILARIATRMPDITFEVYGRRDCDFSADDLFSHANVKVNGEFHDFAAIPKSGIAAFLYTSRVDGMPHVLLEAGASGLPVIAPLIGGIGELIDDSTGWLVSDAGNVEEYIRHIRCILDYPELARQKAANLQLRVNERHNWSAFLSRVQELRISEDTSNGLLPELISSNEPIGKSEVLDSALFDQDFYLRHNPDVAEQKIDALTHYLLHGGFEGRSPHPLFDSDYYAKKIGNNDLNPLIHYLQFGAKRGIDPHPLFSTSFYLEQGLSMEACSYNALTHYLKEGASNGIDPHPLFDGSYYMEQVEKLDEKVGKVNPLIHYLEVGSKLGLNPAKDFDANAYYARYSDVARGGVNPLVHYLTLGELEGRTRRNIVGIADATAIVRSASFQSALRKMRALTQAPFSHLIISESLTRGGAVRCACQFFMAIADRVGLDNVVFLIADELDVTCEDWLPLGARILNLLHLEKTLTGEDRSLLLLELVARMRPKIAMGFNSFTFWKTLDWHINTCLREVPTKFVGYLGGYEDYVEMNGWGFNDGPVNTLTPLLPLIVTDNDRLRDTMLERHKEVPSIDSKVVSCYKSLTEELMNSLSRRVQFHQDSIVVGTNDCQQRSSIEPINSQKPVKILWASRLDGVKQPATLAAIAEQMPDVQFDVYGRAYTHIDVSCLQRLQNVRLMGEYTDFSKIPTFDKTAFLHTSKSDSMPHVLVEAAAAGLPIVAPDTGAIRELIDDSTGWIVADCHDISEYVDKLRTVIDNSEQSRQRAKNLQSRVQETHSWSAFLKRVEKLDIW